MQAWLFRTALHVAYSAYTLMMSYVYSLYSVSINCGLSRNSQYIDFKSKAFSIHNPAWTGIYFTCTVYPTQSVCRVMYYSISYTVNKSLFVLDFHQKIPLLRIDNPAADTRKFFPPPIDLIHIRHGRKFFGSLEGDLLHSQMPEMSSGPWNEPFYIPPCHKYLAYGGRPCLAPGTRISRHWGM